MTGTSGPTIRYHEEIGLLATADRQAGQRRRYGEEDMKRLTFIRRCWEFGFSIPQVGTLALVQDRKRSCIETRDLAQLHLIAVREEIADLKKLEESIFAIVESCD